MSQAHVVPSHPHLRLGRHPRTRRKMLQFRCLAVEKQLRLTKPLAFDYSQGLPADLGVMGNDKLGDCTAAAKYHRIQLVQFKTTGALLPGEALADLAVAFYEGSTGYTPGNPGTDQGGNMQDIADYLVSKGMPMPGNVADKFVASFEIDTARQADLAYCGSLCGGIDLGIQVTTSVMPADGSEPPDVWDVSPGDQALGGHDVYAFGRLSNGNWIVNSWGKFYQITQRFWDKNVEEAYGYVSSDWIDKTGKTPLGMSLAEWEAAMAAHAASV